MSPPRQYASPAEHVRLDLRANQKIHARPPGLKVAPVEGGLLLEGEVGDVESKKLALERAAAEPGIGAVVDRVRVAPALAMTDGEIRAHLLGALRLDRAFENTAIREASAKRGEPSGRTIDVRVEDGVVTLDGEVESLTHKRLAGAFAWWIPGTRDVVNGLGVEPAEEDEDGEITDAVRLVLSRDRMLDADRIRVGTLGAVVTLEGAVPTSEQREMAEFDAWCTFGVNGVENRLTVRH